MTGRFDRNCLVCHGQKKAPCRGRGDDTEQVGDPDVKHVVDQGHQLSYLSLFQTAVEAGKFPKLKKNVKIG